MSEPYLIAHKVRGESAFDIAEQLQVGGETWWIIPTSGHRAYPYWTCLLAQFGCCEVMDETYVRVYSEPYQIELEPPPSGHPDHYSINDAPARRSSQPPSTLESLA